MITTIISFAFMYFVLWICFKLLGLVLKIALFPVKIAISLIFAIIGYVIFPALILFFLLPLIVVFISWLISKNFIHL